MGVDFKLVSGNGVCLNINLVNSDEKLANFIKSLEDYHISWQDNYGNSDGEARLFIYKHHVVLCDMNVGRTPFAFLETQEYRPSHDTVVYGGARKYIAIETKWKENINVKERDAFINELNAPVDLREKLKEGYNNWLFSFYW